MPDHHSYLQLIPVWQGALHASLDHTRWQNTGLLASLADFFTALEKAEVVDQAGAFLAVLKHWCELVRICSPDPSGLYCQWVDAVFQPVWNFQLQPSDSQPVDGNLAEFVQFFGFVRGYFDREDANRQLAELKSELQRVQAELERIDQSKSDFISVAAHELKTPLTLVEGYSAMLRELLDLYRLDRQVQVLLNGIDGGAHRLREIIDDMIDVSLIDNNLLQLNFQPLWLDQLLEMLSREVAVVLQQRRIRLEFRRFDGCHEMTFGDPERLFQAFLNLLNNAIKFTPDGGAIYIDGRLLPGFVEMTIRDTGIGIAPEDHVRIFEKFQRLGETSLHSTSKTRFKGGGPGLGLPITKGIIETHGGALWVESLGYDEVKCPGSTFHVLLPIRKTPPDAKLAKLFGPLATADFTISGSESTDT